MTQGMSAVMRRNAGETLHTPKITSLLDNRLDGMLQNIPFSQRNGEVSKEVKNSLRDVFTLKGYSYEYSDAEKITLLGHLRENITERGNELEEERVLELYKKQQQKQEKQKVPVVVPPIVDAPKKPVEMPFYDIKTILKPINLSEETYKKTSLTDLQDHAKAFAKNSVGMLALYKNVTDVARFLLLPAWKKVEESAINAKNHRENSVLLDKDTYKNLMEYRHLLRTRCAIYLLPTQTRPYGVHPAYLFEELKKHIPLTPEEFSGIVAEIRGDYCINGYQSESGTFEKAQLDTATRIKLDLAGKTDELYSMTDANSRKTWFAVDFKKDYTRQETTTMYDSSKPTKNSQYTPYVIKAIRYHVPKTKDAQVNLMISYVHRGSIYSKVFTMENMPAKRTEYMETFLAALG